MLQFAQRSTVALLGTLLSLAGASDVLAANQGARVRPAAGFAYLEADSTGSARRLVSERVDVELGRAGDGFVDLLELENRDLVAAGQRLADGVESLVVVRVDATEGVPMEVDVPRSIAGNRQIGPRLTRAAEGFGQSEAGALSLAWLEPIDARRSEVWVADSRADGFRRPYKLAAAGPGGQIALAGATRHDGAQFYVWSRFDGVDSEIFWSQRDRAMQPEWTRPQRLHPNNEVPDINPTLATVGDQVFAAWSSYDFALDDGTYRVYLARFDNGSWTAPTPVSGAGGIYPRFVSSARMPTLSHLNAKRSRWEYQQLSLDGKAVAAASVAKQHSLRPHVLAASDAGLVLRPQARQGLERRARPSAAGAVRSLPTVTAASESQSTAKPSAAVLSTASGGARLTAAPAVMELSWEDPR